MRFAHTNIISKDWENLAAFYVNTFNCVVVPPTRNQSGEWLEKGTGVHRPHLKGVHLLLPGYGKKGPTLEIYSYHEIIETPQSRPNQRGYGHIAFEVENVRDVYEKVMKNGGSAQGEIVHRNIENVGTLEFVYVRDPEGNLIELQSWS